jgi:hypothetical protein
LDARENPSERPFESKFAYPKGPLTMEIAIDPENAEQGEEIAGNATLGGANAYTESQETGLERFADPSELG